MLQHEEKQPTNIPCEWTGCESNLDKFCQGRPDIGSLQVETKQGDEGYFAETYPLLKCYRSKQNHEIKK